MFRVRNQIGCETTYNIKPESVPTIAVLDTGVMLHPDLSNRIVGFKDFVNGKNSVYDDSGHGTHVCGIIAGDGRLSAGKYKGVAPFAKLFVGKVLNHEGNGMADAMAEGIGWVIENALKYKIRVLNISVGIGELQDKTKERMLIRYMEKAWEEGLLVVCAAGNKGPEPGSISALGRSSRIITVGCHDGEYFKDMPGRCETYSARGVCGRFAERKPDIVAPGTAIVSCDANCKKSIRGFHNAYTKKSGTSMATAIVSGVAGVLYAHHENYKNDHAKKKILYSAQDLGEPWCKQGYGMVSLQNLLK
ncbi:MAG: S8 family serine peptidase [Lachnospiraceae bacterium]|nr:S8 family serine peptidase [Lachnospiraceae bacterium]